MPEWPLPAAVPLALLPVRLETRFRGNSLLIRVFPDQIHVDSHEPDLTAAEVTAGKEYWQAVWTAPDETAELAAWDTLAESFGAERGAWIARVLRPTNPGARPGGTPQFPSLGTPKPTAWMRPPLARELPTRWHAVGIPIGYEHLRARATGGVIVNPLQVGPSPQFDPSSLPADQPPIDPGTRWLVDYTAAEAAGMGLNLPPPAEVPPDQFRGWRKLFVYGVQESGDGSQGAQALAGLLDAHYHTSGFSFLAQGTPTNNTPGAAAAPSRGDPAYKSAYRPKLVPVLPTAADSNAVVLARALGLPVAGAVGLAAGSAERERAWARWMQTALWRVTWGYFLSHMLGADVTDAQVARVRRHVLDWVRPAGPLPTLRVGSQPYGVLPVLATGAYRQREGSDFGADALGEGTVAFLQRLRAELWQPSTTSVPRAAERRGPETAVRILGMGAHAQAYYGRSLLGMDYMAYLWRFSEPEVGLGPGWRTELTEAAAALGARLGLGAWNPRVGRAVFASQSFPVPGARVQAAGGEAARSYLSRLGSDTLTPGQARDAIHAGTPERTPLLYRLLRHSLLLEHALAAARVQQRGGLPPGPAEPELVDIVPGPVTATIWRQLARERQWQAGGPTERLDTYLARTAATEAAMADVREFRAAVRALADLGVPELERLMAQTVDIASHRLDAWLTSFATRRLAWLRLPEPAPRAVGVRLGGYSWVEELRPRTAPVAAGPVDQEPVVPEQGPVPTLWLDTGAGFVHAPSLGHATSAAVLSGGYHAYGGGQQSPFQIDLRSHRVQLAAWLLDGVRQGQPLGALLGYRVERAIQEHPRVGLPAYLPALRRRFPRRTTGVSVEGGTTETVRTFNVVDGLALHRAREAGQLDLGRHLGVTDPNDRQALQDVLAGLAETVDAVHDALLSEGVHHVVQGNPLRAGATVDAADRGEAPPPELDVARTPRRGVAVTHRLAVLLGAGDAQPAGWPVDPDVQARATAEPRLNRWVARLLPAPARVRCRFEAVGAAGGNVVRRELDLAVLRLSPLDLLYLPERDAEAGRSELELRLEAAVRALPDVGPAAQVRLDLRWSPSAPEALSVADLLEVLRRVRALLDASRPLAPRDLAVPEADAHEADEDLELEPRAVAGVDALDRAATDLADLSATAPDSAVRRGLRRAAHLGVAGALPDATPLLAHAVVVARELARRQAAVAALDADHAAGKLTGAAYRQGQLQAVFGPDFRVLRSFVPPGGPTLTTALAASTDAQGGDSQAAGGWLHQVAKVRRGADRLLSTVTYAEALETGHVLSLDVVQLPYTPGERWLGLTQTGEPPGSRLSLVLHAPDGRPAEGAAVAGLAVEEWVEVIPTRTETTGITFNFDAPGACAPQAILLAVSPDARAQWNTELVEDTLAEALALSQLRMVDLESLHPSDPDAMTDIGQLLPAAHLATNVQPGDAIATDLTRGSP